MRDILQAVAAGELSPEAAEAQLSGYATVDAGTGRAIVTRLSDPSPVILVAVST